jgi:hypothetical protein
LYLAQFGKIWKAVRNEQLLTPQAYERELRKLYAKQNFDIVDVFCIPDYSKFFSGCLDPRFQGWAREERTQLQWRFDKPPCPKDVPFFPFGARVQYRAFSSD